MNLYKKEVGLELKNKIEQGCDLERISKWAYDVLYMKIQEYSSSEIDNILSDIAIMDAGPEFQLTEQQLRSIAEQWINEYTKDPDPSISLSAIPLDDFWLMCPDCIDAWESTTKDAMVDCPKCHKYFHNPRYQA